MSTASASSPTLMARLWPQTAGNAALRAVVLVLLGTALLAASAHIQVPFWPVKLSMQSFVVVVLGMAYGRTLGVATVLAYLAQGAVGMPVFQSGAGIAYMAGPTGGYLAGFVLAAGLAGWCVERGALERLSTAFLAILAATAAIFVPGLAWLAVLFGAEKAIAFGLIPFLPGEALKIALALALVPAIRRFTR